MTPPFSRLVAAALLSMAIAAAGCKNGKRAGLFNQAPEPSVAGSWVGTMNTATSTATVSVTLTQNTLDIDGDYTAPLAQAAFIGIEGTIAGVTTGSSFLMTLTPDDPGCVGELQLGGTNDGSEMEFSFSGVDCSSAAVSGQGYFNRVP